MFTDNYINFRNALFSAKNYNNTFKVKDAAGTTVNATVSFGWIYDIGSWMTLAQCKAINATHGSTVITNKHYQGVYFGSGSTPATKADYQLENPITSGLSITNPSDLVWQNDSDGKYAAIADFLVRNTTEAEVNIYEIGVFVPVTTSSGSAANLQIPVNYVLMERTVLSEPVTIAPGEAKLVTYKITFNQTLNVE